MVLVNLDSYPAFVFFKILYVIERSDRKAGKWI